MPYDEMSPAERDLRTSALNSNSTIKILSAIQARLDASASPPQYDGAAAARSGANFLAAVRASVLHLAGAERMLNAVTTISGEQVGRDGGFALPAAWAPRVERIVFASSFLGALTPRPVASDIFRVPTDNTPPWSSSGPQAPAVAEGAQVTPTKPALGLASVSLFRRSVFVPATDEAVTWGGQAFFDYVEEVLLARVREAMEAWVVAGKGTDEPLGFLNSPGAITIAKEGSQAAGTLVKENLGKMAASVTRFADAVWVAHPRCLEQFTSLAAPIYLGAGGPAGSLLGRPVFTSEHMSDLGSAGDLALIDPAGIVFAIDGPRLATTIGFAFDQGLQSFRATVEMGAAPKLAAPVPRKNGSGTASHIVILGARS